MHIPVLNTHTKDPEISSHTLKWVMARCASANACRHCVRGGGECGGGECGGGERSRGGEHDRGGERGCGGECGGGGEGVEVGGVEAGRVEAGGVEAGCGIKAGSSSSISTGSISTSMGSGSSSCSCCGTIDDGGSWVASSGGRSHDVVSSGAIGCCGGLFSCGDGAVGDPAGTATTLAAAAGRESCSALSSPRIREASSATRSCASSGTPGTWRATRCT